MNVRRVSALVALALALIALDNPQAAAQTIDQDFYYKLSTQFRGIARKLDVFNGGPKNNLTRLEPDQNFSGQFWKFRKNADGTFRLSTFFRGPDMCLDIFNGGPNNNQPHLAPCANFSGQLWTLTKIGRVVKDNGIEFLANIPVSDGAFKRAEFVVQQMLSNSTGIRKRMAEIGFKVEIIGKDQLPSDVPGYAYLKTMKTFDGRPFDTGTRGVGDRDKCSIGEENLLCLNNQQYPDEDILAHEFAHSMMSNMDPEDVQRIKAAYQNAVDKKLYPQGIYMMANEKEYWAEGVQAWLGVTQRSDVNGGFNTQQKIKDHDKALASILEKVFGPLQLQHVPGCKY